MKRDVVIFIMQDVVFIIGVLAMVIVWLVLEHHFSTNEPEVVRDTIYATDTVYPEAEVIKDTFLRYNTYYLKDTIRDTVPGIIVNDDSILIPITQKEYTDDTTFRAWISGYEPNLDSIQVYQQKMIIKEKSTVKKRQMVNFGIQAGAGRGLFTKQFDVYVGAGVTITLPN